MRPTAISSVLLLLASCARVDVSAPISLPAALPTPTAPEVPAIPSAADEGDPTPPPAPGSSAFDPILTSSVADDAVVRDRMAFWVGLWGENQADLFTRYLERMSRYSNLVDEEIRRRGLPASLRYLPIVESGYLPVAVSRVGAVGLWQLMAPTARELGMGVTAVVDERRDPLAATSAALAYLEQLYTQFDSWILALAAYNAGPGRVGRLLNQLPDTATVPPDERFLLIRSRLPAETRDFIPRFLAAAALGSDPEAFGFLPPASRPWLFDEVLVPDATSLEVVARAAGASEALILELNPHFVRGFTPVGEARAVRVPLGSSFRFERNYALIPPRERLTFLEHVVVAGDTFGHIARQYGVALAELTGVNGQVDPRRLQIGMRLMVPLGSANGGGERSEPTGVVTVAASRNGGTGVHTVSSGESFWTISRMYGVTTEALASANGKAASDLIRVGEELRIP